MFACFGLFFFFFLFTVCFLLFYIDAISHPKLAAAAVIFHSLKTTRHTGRPAVTDSSMLRTNGEGIKLGAVKWTWEGFEGLLKV